MPRARPLWIDGIDLDPARAIEARRTHLVARRRCPAAGKPPVDLGEGPVVLQELPVDAAPAPQPLRVQAHDAGLGNGERSILEVNIGPVNLGAAVLVPGVGTELRR